VVGIRRACPVLTMVIDHGILNLSITQEKELFMDEEVVPISKFKATCLALLDKVKRTGKPILVTRKGEPIALVTSPPLPEKPAVWLGTFQSSGKIVGDIVSPASEEGEWEVLKR